MGVSKRARLRSIHRYLEAKFPGPRPTLVHFIRDEKKDAGLTDWRVGDPEIRITVNTIYTLHECICILVEEHAHAAVIHRHEGHGPSWGREYQKRRELLDDKGGLADSRSY